MLLFYQGVAVAVVDVVSGNGPDYIITGVIIQLVVLHVAAVITFLAVDIGFAHPGVTTYCYRVGGLEVFPIVGSVVVRLGIIAGRA